MITSIIASIVSAITGKNKAINLNIRFHKDANDYREHGTLIASHVGKGLERESVRFVFIGLDEPPAMTPAILAFIWDKAEAEGFQPIQLRSYTGVNTTIVHDTMGSSKARVDSSRTTGAQESNYNGR